MPVIFDKNGNGFHVPTFLHNAAGVVEHPLQRLGIVRNPTGRATTLQRFNPFRNFPGVFKITH